MVILGMRWPINHFYKKNVCCKIKIQLMFKILERDFSLDFPYNAFFYTFAFYRRCFVVSVMIHQPKGSVQSQSLTEVQGVSFASCDSWWEPSGAAPQNSRVIRTQIRLGLTPMQWNLVLKYRCLKKTERSLGAQAIGDRLYDFWEVHESPKEL